MTTRSGLSSPIPTASRRALWCLGVAALAGTLHGLASLHWGFGGTLLLDTLSDSVVESFRGREWLALPIGLAKLVAALTPLVLLARGGLRDRWLRALAWVGATGLVAWGAITAVPAQLVLAGIIRPEGGYDRGSMIGHAWIWEPLFALWGLALAAGLWLSRHRARR